VVVRRQHVSEGLRTAVMEVGSRVPEVHQRRHIEHLAGTHVVDLLFPARVLIAAERGQVRAAVAQGAPLPGMAEELATAEMSKIAGGLNLKIPGL